jgi:hypothetical protein
LILHVRALWKIAWSVRIPPWARMVKIIGRC